MHPLISSLPDNTPEFNGTTLTAIQRSVDIELQKSHPPSYVVFTNVPPNLVNESLDNPSLFGSKARIFYDKDLRFLLLKLPGAPLEVAERHFSRSISRITHTMGLEWELQLLGAGRVSDEYMSKEPNASFRPVKLPSGRSKKWPTLIIECGYSEGIAPLRAMADLWLSYSGGLVKAVILISVERHGFKIIFEKWIPSIAIQSNGNSQSLRNHSLSALHEQEIVITGNQNSQAVVNGGPLIIRFEEIFLRPGHTRGA